MNEFTKAPLWEWWILGYFFIGGIGAGLFVLGGLIRFFGQPEDRPAARTAFLFSVPLTILCPLFLTIDLGDPERFWHMFINTSDGFLSFKIWSPMSVGAWALFVFGGCVTLVFLNQLLARPRLVSATAGGGSGTAPSGFLPHILENILVIAGMITGVYIMGYTGVLLSVSNQPIWSNVWLLGALFMASALSTSTATLILLLLWRKPGGTILVRLQEAILYLAVLELFLLGLVAIMVEVASSNIKGSNLPFDHNITFWMILAGVVLIASLALRFVVSYLKVLKGNRVLALEAILLLIGGVLLRFFVVFVLQI